MRGVRSSMKGMTPRNEKEREFIKIFDSLCYTRSRWQIWSDFVHMSALSIVNAVDKVHFDVREERFKRIVKPYSEKEMAGFAQLLKTTVLALEENPFQDFLGELYMRCDLGNESNGQFFTPYHICEFMAKILMDGQTSAKDDIEKNGYIGICDPCIGGGAMLIGAAQALHQMGINYQQDAVFVGQDIDANVAMMAYIQLSLLGCPGYIKIGNSLTEPMTGNVLFGDGKETTFYMPMFFTEKMEFLRHMALVRKLFYTIGGPANSRAEPDAQPENTVPVVSAGETVVPAVVPAAEEKPPVQDGPPIIEISKKKGKALVGQTMFDFGI